MDTLLILLRSLTVNPESKQTVRDTATKVRNLQASDDAEAIVLEAVARHLSAYADAMEG